MRITDPDQWSVADPSPDKNAHPAPGRRRLPDQDQATNPVGGNGQQPAANHRRAVTYATPCSAAHSFKFTPEPSHRALHRALLSAIGRLPSSVATLCAPLGKGGQS
jgi:hypothetical protein